MSASDFLSLPRAHGGAAGRATLRRDPEDFCVREWLGFEADGEGDHVLLRVRKRSANTVWVAKQLARVGKVHVRDVGYAGLKDRDAIAEQAFTLPLRSAVGEQWVGVSGEGFEVISAQRHRRKLKRGALRGNEFVIVLRGFEGDLAALERKLTAIAEQGAPNYFGPQRFGRAGNNIDTALRWFQGGDAPENRLQRGFAISAARSAIFNSVLAERVRKGTWNRLLLGDLANLDGSGSFFSVENVDEILDERCRVLDLHPTGPLWHGASAASMEVKQFEDAIADRHAPLANGLAQVGLEPERRALRMRISDLKWSIDAGDVHLSFRLTKGSFATAVLNELIENAEAEEADSG